MGDYRLAWRPKKRSVQFELTDRLTQIPEFNHKKVIVLCGPDLDACVAPYEMHDLHKNGIILAEIDRRQVYKAILHSSKKNLGDGKYILKDNKRAQIINEDIFGIADRYKGKISGFDFDFCTTLNNDKIHKIYSTVKDSKVQDAWVRITTCHRGINRDTMKEMLEYTRHQFHEEFDELDLCKRGYRDRTSPSMNVWQIVLRRKKMEEQTTNKRMRDLKAREKDMLRALVEHKNLYRNITAYNETDIANLFGVSKETISAVKAVSTMRSKKDRGY
jgi:hypothetical protein